MANNGNKRYCYTCNQEIVFDAKKVGSKSGKPIPLNPLTKEAHSCDTADIEEFERTKALKDLDETNGATKPAPPTFTTAADNHKAVAMHSQARLKVFKSTDPMVLEGFYNSYANKARSLGAREKGTPSIALLNQQGIMEFVLFYYYDIPNENAEKIE